MLFARRTALRVARQARPERVGIAASQFVRPLAPSIVRALSSNEAAGQSQQNVEEKHVFKAETAKILDIVSKSLYSERDVFLRELISNASDALEKFRFHKATTASPEPETDVIMAQAEKAFSMTERPLEIRIETDKDKKTLTISDSGIGMTKQEMLDNLGTIGKSGSADFLKDNKNSTIIGKFGVGFYSAFMVGDRVEVTSRSAKSDDDGYIWRSNGTESFTLEPTNSKLTPIGTSITIHMRDEEFSDPSRVKGAIERYSNFVSFPIFLNGDRVNSVEALWTEEPAKVSQQKHEDFYKFVYNSFEGPMYTLHYRTDAPIDIKALLYIPKHNPEQMGTARTKPGLSLYTRKVLLQKESDLLPGWARFVQGIVDSEDLPLSLSRETAQDKRLIDKMGKAVSRRLLRFLKEKATNDVKSYQDFWKEFGHFIKEGVCSDFDNQPELAKLLRFDTSSTKPGEPLVSLDEVLSRMPPTQKNIYYLSAPNRKLAESSPYFEIFKKKNVEVIFLYRTLDDFTMNNLRTFEGRNLVAAESGDIEEALKDKGDEKEKLSDLQSKDLCDWMKATLKDVASAVKVSSRLEGFPAVVVDHESATLRRMMRMVNPQETSEYALPKQKLEINPSHKLIKSLDQLRKNETEVATKLARLIFDGALIQAGIMDDPRDVIPRYNDMLEQLIESKAMLAQAVAAGVEGSKMPPSSSSTAEDIKQ